MFLLITRKLFDGKFSKKSWSLYAGTPSKNACYEHPKASDKGNTKSKMAARERLKNGVWGVKNILTNFGVNIFFSHAPPNAEENQNN